MRGLRRAQREDTADDEHARQLLPRDPLAEERRGQRHREEDARLADGGDRRGRSEAQGGQHEHIGEEAAAAGEHGAQPPFRPQALAALTSAAPIAVGTSASRRYGTGFACSIPSTSVRGDLAGDHKPQQHPEPVAAPRPAD